MNGVQQWKLWKWPESWSRKLHMRVLWKVIYVPGISRGVLIATWLCLRASGPLVLKFIPPHWSLSAHVFYSSRRALFGSVIHVCDAMLRYAPPGSCCSKSAESSCLSRAPRSIVIFQDMCIQAGAIKWVTKRGAAGWRTRDACGDEMLFADERVWTFQLRENADERGWKSAQPTPSHVCVWHFNPEKLATTADIKIPRAKCSNFCFLIFQSDIMKIKKKILNYWKIWRFYGDSFLTETILQH